MTPNELARRAREAVNHINSPSPLPSSWPFATDADRQVAQQIVEDSHEQRDTLSNRADASTW
jgi:hypothetical protein